jgi:hypothetical protein
MIKEIKAVSVQLTEKFYRIQTHAVVGIFFVDPYAVPYYHDVQVDDETLGISIRSALNASRKANIDEFNIIRNSGILKEYRKQQDTLLIKNYGYKNKTQMYKQMKNCSITLQVEFIEIQPSRHTRLEYWSGLDEIIQLPKNVSDTDLGVAVKKGFSLCK